MKPYFFLLLAVCISSTAFAQLSPVNWEVTAEKIEDGTFDLTFTAEIQDGWKVYSQFTPEGGPQPTAIELESGQKVDTPKETGDRKEREDALFGVEVIEFTHTYTIQQRVKVPAGTTTLSGTVNYMTCDGERCLPPTDVNFNVSLR